MTDKEFRKLSRSELIDIIFELQQRYETIQNENNRLKQTLEKRELNIANAGSLADAVMKINGVFEAAQAAADQYLLSVQAQSEQTLIETQDHVHWITTFSEEDGQQKGYTRYGAWYGDTLCEVSPL